MTETKTPHLVLRTIHAGRTLRTGAFVGDALAGVLELERLGGGGVTLRCFFTEAYRGRGLAAEAIAAVSLAARLAGAPFVSLRPRGDEGLRAIAARLGFRLESIGADPEWRLVELEDLAAEFPEVARPQLLVRLRRELVRRGCREVEIGPFRRRGREWIQIARRVTLPLTAEADAVADVVAEHSSARVARILALYAA